MSTARWQARRLPVPAAWPARSSRTARPWAIISAALAPALLTGGYLIAGILQPASYSPMRKTISVMAGQAGTDRWIMTGGIFLAGGCYLITAAGLTGIRAAARALLIVAGLAGIGIAASPEPASGTTPQHLAWTTLGAVTIAVWPAFAAPRTPPRPLILSSYGSAAVTAVFAALLGWLFIETRDGSVLGLAERLTSSIQTCWPFTVALTLRRTRRPRPGLAIGGSGGVKDGVTAAGPGPRPRAGLVMAARLEAPWAGARPVTATAPARRAGLGWPRLPAAAELAAIGSGYVAYALLRLALHADRHAPFAHAAQPWQAERRMHLRIEPWLNRVLLRAAALSGHPAGAGMAVPAQACGVRPAAPGAGAGRDRRQRGVLGLAGRPAPARGSGDDRHPGHPRHPRRSRPARRHQPGEPLRGHAQPARRLGRLVRHGHRHHYPAAGGGTWPGSTPPPPRWSCWPRPATSCSMQPPWTVPAPRRS
jgi:hypothetical membrane protein